MASREAIRKRMEEDRIEYILTQFVDIHGAAKVKMVPVTHFDDVLDVGAGFAGGAVWGLGQGPHSHDMLARIDLDSYTPLPWKEGVARFASDLYVDDEPYLHCPRLNLKRVLADVKREGYNFNVGIEPEHFLVTRKADGSIAIWDPNNFDTLEKACYDYKGIAGVMDYLRDMMDGLNRLGWDSYQSDHEDANGQYEVNFAYSDALTTADRYTFFKMMTSQLAQKYGAIATHMPKPFTNRTGSAAHIHFHLADAQTGENLFLDESDPKGLGLSELAYHFIGGIMAHAPALCGVTSPTVNCYKRLQVGTASLHGSTSGYIWTPAFVFLWGQQPHSDDSYGRPGPLGGQDSLGGLQSLPGPRYLRPGRSGWHSPGAGPRRAEPGQPVRPGPGGDSQAGHPGVPPELGRVIERVGAG